MKRMKRAVSCLLSAAILAGSMSICVSAAYGNQQVQAKALYELGLMQGYDKTGNNFGLDDRLTREAAIIFLIRLLGEESAAKSWNGPSPFTDVPEDSGYKPYIGYAKEKGYTSGVGNDKFGLGTYATMKHMVSFTLHGLGYSDPDYTYDGCLDMAVSKGILTSNQEIANFDRGDAVEIMFRALSAAVKDQNYDLLDKLMSDGVVTQAQYDKAMEVVEKGVEPPKPTTPAKPAGEDPLPPEITKSPDWYMKLKKPQFKTNADLVADYEKLWAWMMLPDSKYTEPVMAREDELSRELHGRAEKLDDYVTNILESQSSANNAYWQESFRTRAEKIANSSHYQNAIASDMAPLKPYLENKTIEYFGL